MPENEGTNEGRAENFLHRADGSSVSNAPVNDRVVSLTAPGSVAAEQYRSLYYRLERLREQRPMRLVAFASLNNKMLATCAIASTCMTPGMTGWPGKCPWKNGSLIVTVFTPTHLVSVSKLIMRSTMRKGKRCGKICIT